MIYADRDPFSCQVAPVAAEWCQAAAGRAAVAAVPAAVWFAPGDDKSWTAH